MVLGIVLENPAFAVRLNFMSRDHPTLRGALRTGLCSVVNSQDFDALLLHAVDSDVGQGRKQELSGAILASHAATIGPTLSGSG